MCIDLKVAEDFFTNDVMAFEKKNAKPPLLLQRFLWFIHLSV